MRKPIVIGIALLCVGIIFIIFLIKQKSYKEDLSFSKTVITFEDINAVFQENPIIYKVESLKQDYNTAYYAITGLDDNDDIKYYLICIYKNDKIVVAIEIMDDNKKDQMDYAMRNGLNDSITVGGLKFFFTYDEGGNLYKVVHDDNNLFYKITCYLEEEKEFLNIMMKIFG